MTKPTISVIITTHTEGLLVHKAIASVLEATQQLTDHKISFEILLHLDNADDFTRNCLSRYRKDPRFRIYENHFGDLGSSRNFSVQKAKGEIVTCLDGDDLVSANWLISAYHTLVNGDGPAVIHPEVVLSFGIDTLPVLWAQSNSTDPLTDATLLIGANRWNACAFAYRQTFLDTPYIVAKDGYGFEDWFFNAETLAKHIPHRVAPETTLFYRRNSNESVLDSSNAGGFVQPYSVFFDQATSADTKANIQSNTKRVNHFSKSSAYRAIRRIYRAVARTPLASERLEKHAYNFVNAVRSHHNTKIPDFIITACRDINHLESQIYPTNDFYRDLIIYHESCNIECGIAYYKLMSTIQQDQKPKYVFIVPWVSHGGADKVIINYAKAIQEIHPSDRIAVITTLPSRNEARSLLPSNVDFIDFGNISKDLPPHIADSLFSRLITQSKCSKIHIINSEFAYNWIKKHLSLAKHLDIRLSIFCDDFVAGSHGKGVFNYGDKYLPLILPAVKHIYSDNLAIVSSLVERCGVDPALFTVHYQPADLSHFAAPKPAPRATGQLRVLWASRICPQKNPELLKQIAAALPAEQFQIDVYGRLEQPYSAKFFDTPANIHYCGPFRDIDSIPFADYDVFLYTSYGDGMPNTLLEVASRGLPIIASNVGGVGELIFHKKTGLLAKHNTLDEFVTNLQYAREHYPDLVKWAKNAQKLLLKQHATKEFVSNVEAMLK